MNPLRIRAANYRTFEQLDLELPAGCVGVLGLNGHGKSSIVNVIDLALFGPEGRSWAPYLTVGAVSTELMVELVFEHAGETYRVRRGYSAKGAGKSTLDLERCDLFYGGRPSPVDDIVKESNVWEALTLGSAKETQARLEEILGFTRRTLRASSLLHQGDGAAFTEADPRDRKRILADALGLDRWEQLLAAVRRDRRTLEHELARIGGRLAGVTAEGLAAEREQFETAIRDLDTRQADSATRLAALDQELAEVASRIEQGRRAASDRAAAIATRDAAAAALSAKVKIQEDADAARAQLAEVTETLRTLPTSEQLSDYERREQELAGEVVAHEQAVRDHDQAVRLVELRTTERQTIAAQATAARRKAEELDEKIRHLETGELDSCPTCQQQLGADARAATVGSLRAQAQTAADEAQAFDERADMIEIPTVPPQPELEPGLPLALQTVRDLLRAAREAEVQRGRLTERAALLNQQIDAATDPAYLAELQQAQTALHDAEAAVAALPEPADVASLELDAVTLRGRVEAARQEQSQAQADLAVHRERLEQLTLRQTQAADDLATQARHQVEVELLAILERAYGPDGIPALIVENAAIPSIELEGNRILTELGGTTAGCRLELRTDRQKADGGIRDDVLDVIVVTDAGERPYETFSGGERTRLNLALRIALARLLATRRGAESRVLAIDEPEFLDQDGTEALVDVLRDLERAGAFDRVYLVSHVPALRDSFDTVLSVVKDEQGRSSVLGALEAVPA